MPDSDRGIGGSLVVWLFAIAMAFLLACIIFQAGLENGKAIGENEANSNTYASHADKQIRDTCLDLEPPPMAECIRGIVEAANENKRAEKDLVAQTEMSLWAFGALVVSVFTIMVTAVGVWFVKLTLDTTVRAVAETASATGAMVSANEIMRAQQRPWVTLEWAVPCEFRLIDRHFKINWSYQFLNRGASPANRVRMTYDIYRFDWRIVGAGRQGIENEIECAIRTRDHGGALLFQGDRTEFVPDREWSMIGRLTGDDSGTLFLCYCLIYDLDSTGREFGYEAGALVVETMDDGMVHPFGTNLLKVQGYQRAK